MHSTTGIESSGEGREAYGLTGNFGIRMLVGVVSMLVFTLGFEKSANAALAPVDVSQVKDIWLGPDDGSPMDGGDENTAFGGVDLNGTLIFDAESYGAGEANLGKELWRSDGTEDGTTLVKNIASMDFSSSPSELVKLNGEVFFTASLDGVQGSELWKSDGTEAGTELVKDIDPMVVKSGSPKRTVNVGGTLYFLADSDDTDGDELWKSDGTTDGTMMVKDIKADLMAPAYNFTGVGNRLFFTQYTVAAGKELWTSNGTPAGTGMVKDIGPGATGGLPGPVINGTVQDFVAYEGFLYFRADDGTNGLEPWRSDGTGPGTEMVKDIATFPGDGSMTGQAYFTELNGDLYFSTDFQLYKTDGTELGTEAVTNPAPFDMKNVGGALYFHNNYELYRSDGTMAGTEVIYDFTHVSANEPPRTLTDFNGTLYLAADDGLTGVELWRSDGTTAGTERVTDISPFAGDSQINSLTVVGDRLFFRGDDEGPTGLELWAAYSDVNPPETTIDSGPGEGETIEADSATFTFSSDEPGSTLSCSFDGGTPEPCDSGTKTYSGLSEGSHTFSVAATDAAPFNNVDPTPATRGFSYSVPIVVEPPDPPDPPDTTAPKLRLKLRKKQTSRKRILVKATCLDEACTLKATGRIKIKILKKNGKVKKTKKIKLKQARSGAAAGKTIKLKIRLNRKAKRLVRKVIRKKPSRATIRIFATDAAGNTSSAKRRVTLKRKRR